MSDYGKKECLDCEGVKQICSGCKNPSWECECKDPVELEACWHCDGTGEVDRTLEDHEDELEYLADQAMDERKLGHL